VLGERVRPGDRDDVHDIVARHSGALNAELFCYWLDRRPESFVIYRRDGVVQSLLCKLSLHEVDDSELRSDPLCFAAWRWSRQRGVEDGQPLLLDRCMLDRDVGEFASPGVVLAAQEAARQIMACPDLTLDFIVCIDSEFWTPFYTGIGFSRVPELTAMIGPQQFATFVHDWRSPEVPDLWRDVPPRPASPSASDPDRAFADAVRQALKNFTRPGGLARSSLLRTSLAVTEPELRDVLKAAVESLQNHPRDRRLFRALDCTYIHPAATQELAAKSLGLPFSTYRRHLTQGLNRVVVALWAVSRN
jgi:hypothetical protein